MQLGFSSSTFLYSVQKERDLELAARIGQSLLKQNQELTARNERLDERLEMATEEVKIKFGVKKGGYRQLRPTYYRGAGPVCRAEAKDLPVLF